MKISVSTTINAAHQLPGTLLHGHTYRITAIVDMEKDADSGRTFEFSLLRGHLARICGAFDHDRLERCLQELPATAENLATNIARSLSKVLSRVVNIRIAVGDDGIVETEMYKREDGEYFSR